MNCRRYPLDMIYHSSLLIAPVNLSREPLQMTRMKSCKRDLSLRDYLGFLVADWVNGQK